MTPGVHLFPYRTQKLSPVVPTIVGWWRPVKIGRCQHLYSSIAQSVERMTVNHDVTGSSPVGGAKRKRVAKATRFSFVFNISAQRGSKSPCRRRKVRFAIIFSKLFCTLPCSSSPQRAILLLGVPSWQSGGLFLGRWDCRSLSSLREHRRRDWSFCIDEHNPLPTKNKT